MDPKKSKILLVEDESIIIDMYKIKFRLAGLNLLVSPSAAEAVKTAEEKKPDLILIDLQLENHANGFDVLRTLKSKPESKNIPMYILSNKRAQGNREEALKLGAVDFLSKTEITPEQLVRIVIEKLNQN